MKEQSKNEINVTKCTYLSLPIQTGKALYLQMKKDNETSVSKYLKEHYKIAWEIRKFNFKKAENFLNENVNRFHQVINPCGITGFLTGGAGDMWKSDDYLDLELEVISKHAEQMVFFEGWEYSIGCLRELKAALFKNIELYECYQDVAGNWNQYLKIKNILACKLELSQSFLKACGVENEAI